MVSGLVERILTVPPVWVYLAVGLLVFAEDAALVGFVVPGETAAILGGVTASRGHVSLAVIATVVVVAAIAGDSVGYQIGRRIGPRLMDLAVFERRRARLEHARDVLSRRGGLAVFLARLITFARTMMPALAGIAAMPRRRFLTFNALGALAWGTGNVLLGYLAGTSYTAIAHTAGPATALTIAVVVVVVAAGVVWRIHRHRARSPNRPTSTHLLSEDPHTTTTGPEQ
ncbi:membrane-associated protein [Nocardia sp. GAS34]|uniref:DedA family protein n=1 Tax=unclassified Nocardia TaxID=2637762 RepID=UPI003D209B46